MCGPTEAVKTGTGHERVLCRCRDLVRCELHVPILCSPSRSRLCGECGSIIVYFRFSAGLLLALLVSLVAIRLEKETLELRRAVSVQYYQTDLLLELLVRLRLESQKLTAPAQLALIASRKAVPHSRRQSAPAAEEKESSTHSGDEAAPVPLLQFLKPIGPKGID